MNSPVLRVLSWSSRRRAAVAAGAVILMALAALGAARLSFDTDVLSLLPRDGRVIPAFRTFVERFGSLDELYVVFTAPDGHSIEDYAAQIEIWIAALGKAPEIQRLDTGRVDRSRDLRWLADRQLLLMREPALRTALDRLRGEGARAAIAARRELLALPSPDIADVVRQDPLGLYDLLRSELRGAQSGVNLGVSAAGYLTADSRSRLVIAHPARPPYDTEFSRALLARIDSIRAAAASLPKPEEAEDPLPPLTVDVAGGHVISVETENLVKRESILNTVVSLGLILPLLYLVFRSVWLVLVGPVPAALSLAVVLGLLGLAGATLSAAATASAAMLFGLGIDGVVLLYVAHMRLRHETADPHALAQGLSGPASSMLLGMWTTAATFYGLTLVDFPSLQQLGLLIGHSMLLCGVLTLVLVPATLPHRVVARGERTLSVPRLASWVQRHRGAILWGAIAATVTLGAAAVSLRVNPTLDRLRSVTPAATRLDVLAKQFGLAHDVYVIIQRGPVLDELLANDEQLVHRIDQTLPEVPVQRASALLPSEATQAARHAAIAGAVPSPAAVSAALEQAAAAEGFRPRSFEPFEARLPHLLAPDQNVSYQGYVEHGLGDVIGRFIAKAPDGWLLVSYAFPANHSDAARLEQLVREAGHGVTLTGLPLVNAELAERFLPQFLKGLAIGSALVLALIVVALRDWRLSLLSLVPTLLGLTWAAGVLALARIELDLFAVFAVATFVGIGVDYGVHLVHRYHERGDAREAIAELAPVILVAAGITLLGYGTLVLSSYPPLRSIGVVSVVAVITLAAASVIVLPALLAGGRGHSAQACQSSRGSEAVLEFLNPANPKSREIPENHENDENPLRPAAPLPRRWTLHGLNNGVIFGATYHGVRTLPRSVSYRIGHGGTWLAWQTMKETRRAVAANLAPLFPHENADALERRALETLRSYANDTIDFLRALSSSPRDTRNLFEMAPEYRSVFTELTARGRGIILVTGHYGNWEIGSLLIRRELDLPLTIVAMAEANPNVNRIRRDIRESLGADTLEVRQSFDTALQIRRRLAGNHIVAMLMDRHYGRDRVQVTLFGQSAWFLRTPLLMAHATGAPVLPCFIERLGPGRFLPQPAEPILIATDRPRDVAIQQAAQKVADILADRIGRHPEFWYHFYRYWDAQHDAYEGLA